MASRIKLKRSLTPNSVPTTSDLTDKEVGLNINDRTLFVNNNGNIVEVLNADPNDEKIVPSMLSGAITDGVGKTWYVSTNGTDQATLGSVNPRHGETTGANVWGKTPTTSFASLKYALDNYVQEGDTVIVAAGTFTETFPLTVPVGVTITGDSSKSTFIKPTVGTNQLDAFLIEGNCTIQDICVKEFFYNTSNDTGYGFRLKSTYVVSADGRRPYIQRCSVITQGSSVSGSDPRGFAVGDAGRGALVDGSSVGASSAEAALLFNECTFVVPNAVGLYLKNGARAEWLNSFTYFASDSIKGENPGGTGFKGAGKTRLKLNNITGTFNSADTITYYDTDGVTALASGTIDSNDGTYIYVDGQGTGEFTEATADTDGKSISVFGDAQISTTQKKFGTGSVLLDGTGDYLSLATSSDFGFGTSDFAVEAFVRPTSITAGKIFDFRSASPDVAVLIDMTGAGVIRLNVNGSNVITGGTLTVNTWHHLAVSRVSGVTSLFIDGTRVGSAYTDTNNYGTSKSLKIGANFNGADPFTGYIDEIRISKGAARYANAGTITVPTAEFAPDVNTSLLIHANGLSGSTNIIDGGVTSQDIRSSSGGSAAFITLADYTDFGAELRSIGSASVYGTRGVTAAGKGVRLRCVVHNFGYVGLDADQSNDISNVVQADEVIESGGGRVLFTSMDQNGDFRVGNAFFVDQENGTVSFAGGDQGSGTTFDQITVTGTGNTTTILPTQISVGNLEFSGDLINNASSNGIELGSTLELIDGASNDPSLTFVNDNTTGLFRDNDFVELNLDANGDEDVNSPIGPPLAFSFNNARKLQVGREVSSLVDFNIAKSSIASITVASAGTNYPPGQHTSPTTGGSGSGAKLALLVSPWAGSITNRGSGYTPALTQAEDVTGGTGTGGQIDLEIFGIEDGTINGGSGYYNPTGDVQVYNNVNLQSGSGTGAQANLTASGGQITEVEIVVHGTGYNVGDVLTASNADLLYTDPVTQDPLTSGGSGFSYTLTNVPGSVKSITPNTTPWTGIGYVIGDVISFTDSFGSGSGFQFTISALGVPTAVGNTDGITLGDTGEGYNVNDRLNTTYNVDTSVPIAGDTWSDLIDGAFNYITYNVLANPGINDTPGNKYFLDLGDGAGYVEAPDLNLQRNYVYNFVFTDGSAGTHPIHFSTTQDGTHNGGTRLTVGATTGKPITRAHYDANGTLDGYQLIVTDELPNTLYYYCEIHTGMAGNSGGGNEAQVNILGTYQGGLAVDVATLAKTTEIELRTDGEIVATTISSGSQTNTGTITSQNLTLLAQSGIGGDLTMDGNLDVGGNITVVGDLAVQGASEFSATVGGAGEISIGDADADIVNLRGDIVFNGVYGTPTPPATLGPLEGANFMVDATANRIGINQHLPLYDLDVTGVVHNTGDVFLASTANETVHIGRDPVAYVHNEGVTLDVSGDVEVTGHLLLQDGSETDPSIRFSSSGEVQGIFAHNPTGTTYGISFTNESGRTAEFNPGEFKFYRNFEFIYESINETTLTGGSGYVDGNYTNVVAVGGNGSGLLYDITVAFETAITTGGAGYDDALYEGVIVTSVTGASAGALQTFTIADAGLNYFDGTYTGVTLTGGTGSSATADITITGGSVSAVFANNVGSAYTVGDLFTVDVADVGGSKLETLTITNGGSGYSDGSYLAVPIVTSSGAGTNATADITVSGGAVTATVVQGQGGGYAVSDSLTIAPDDITISVLSGVNISNAGTGYANGSYTAVGSLQTNVREGLAGGGATFDITVSGNVITAATIDSAGTNYQVGDTLSVASSDIGGDGAGRINGVTITNGGTGYVDEIYAGVAFTGGSGSGGIAEITINGGVIDSIIVTDPGTGYSVGDTLSLSGYGGAAITVNTLVQPSGFELTVSGITVGSGLVLTPNTLITGSGISLEAATVATGTGGSGASADITVVAGIVTEVVITDAGSGFSIGDTIRVNDSDMLYDDGSGQQVPTATPTQQMLLTISALGSVTVANITDFGEGYKIADVLSSPNSVLGGQGSGFELAVDSLTSDITVTIDEKLGQLGVKVFDSETLTVGNSLALTASGIAKTVGGNLNLTTLVDNFVQIGGSQALIIPAGNSASRPVGIEGMIRYNSEVLQFEGFNGISFVSLGGVRDVDLDTFVTAENTTAEDDDTFRFFNENIRTITLTKDKYTLNNADEVEYTDLDKVNLWVEGTTVTSPYAATSFVPDATVVSTADSSFTLTAHNLVEGVIVAYAATGGTVIGGLGDGTEYYVHVVDADTIKLAVDENSLTNAIYVPISGTSTDPQHTFTPVAASVIDVLYYYENRVYSIQTSGTFDALAASFPTHDTGTATNGTVDLRYERTTYSSPTFFGNNFNTVVDKFQINTGAINLKGDITSGIIETESPDLKLQFDNAGTLQPFLKLTRSGGISVNTDYGVSETYKEVLDYELQKLTLVDTQIASGVATLDTSVGVSSAITFGAYTDSYSGKFIVEITDDSATPRKQFSEVSYLVSSDGTNIYYTENSKLYTDIVLCDVTVDVVSNNVQVNINDLTSSSTTVFTIKVVNHNIQA